MTLRFRLSWITKGSFEPKHFKSDALLSAFDEYVGRIDAVADTSVAGKIVLAKKPGEKIWLLERQKNAKVLSSEELAKELSRVMNGGCRTLDIVVGPANGFTKEEVAALQPDLLWSFGPMTLPHELAAVVAAEQLYRAFAILNNHPYHADH